MKYDYRARAVDLFTETERALFDAFSDEIQKVYALMNRVYEINRLPPVSPPTRNDLLERVKFHIRTKRT